MELKTYRAVQKKHFRELSRTELILKAFIASFPGLSQAFANEKFAQSLANPSQLHVLLSQRHNSLTSLQTVISEVLAAAQLSSPPTPSVAKGLLFQLSKFLD